MGVQAQCCKNHSTDTTSMDQCVIVIFHPFPHQHQCWCSLRAWCLLHFPPFGVNGFLFWPYIYAKLHSCNSAEEHVAVFGTACLLVAPMGGVETTRSPKQEAVERTAIASRGVVPTSETQHDVSKCGVRAKSKCCMRACMRNTNWTGQMHFIRLDFPTEHGGGAGGLICSVQEHI